MGSAAAPGYAGEALVGQTSSSGVRLSDSALRHFTATVDTTGIGSAVASIAINTYRTPFATPPARYGPRPAPASATPSPCTDSANPR
ncbi:hypothetical protein F6X42_36255 [Paraburkholderia sp. WC7.3b]|uniref:Uncharacterized protein n=1 Tax=Paraburkholderia podalyriae TaxID=1938811 RepID=A0ABR7PZP0_9BURK|nr:hypothetical protein [Paraburkholderia podalyriae]